MELFDKMNHNDIDRRHLPYQANGVEYVCPFTNETLPDRRKAYRRAHDVTKQVIRQVPGLFSINTGVAMYKLPLRDLPESFKVKIVGWKIIWGIIVPPAAILFILNHHWWLLAGLFLFVNPFLLMKIQRPIRKFITSYCYRSRAFTEFAINNDLISIDRPTRHPLCDNYHAIRKQVLSQQDDHTAIGNFIKG